MWHAVTVIWSPFNCFRKLFFSFVWLYLSSCQTWKEVVPPPNRYNSDNCVDSYSVRQCGYHDNFNVKLTRSCGPKVGVIWRPVCIKNRVGRRPPFLFQFGISACNLFWGNVAQIIENGFHGIILFFKHTVEDMTALL